MRSKGPRPHSFNQICEFTWRGESTLDNGEKRISFGTDHIAKIDFLSSSSKAASHDRVIKGTISGGQLGRNIEFRGTRNVDNLINGPWDLNVSNWKRKYRGINMSAHNRGLAMKWRQPLSSKERDEGPAESDTSNPENEHDVEDCVMDVAED